MNFQFLWTIFRGKFHNYANAFRIFPIGKFTWEIAFTLLFFFFFVKFDSAFLWLWQKEGTQVENTLMYVYHSQQCQLRGCNRLLKDFHRDSRTFLSLSLSLSLSLLFLLRGIYAAGRSSFFFFTLTFSDLISVKVKAWFFLELPVSWVMVLDWRKDRVTCYEFDGKLVKLLQEV